MQSKKQLCRDFQRGSCKYGDRCRYLHATPPTQHQKSNAFGFGSQAGSQPNQNTNPFGFGTQAGSQQKQNSNPFGFGSQAGSQQKQNPNPFGFGVQNNTQQKGANNFGNNQNQQKPFQNTWSRFSPLTNNSAPSSKQPDNQPQTKNHKCTDPESCKKVIAEDFERERPLWKLTCYSHGNSASCDIGGDISFEELRAAAYDDAKRGLSLQSIVERERNLLNAKLMEFENLLRNPYPLPSNSAFGNQSPTPGVPPNAQNNPTSSVFSFNQPSAPLNNGFTAPPPAPSNIAFGPQKTFPSSDQAKFAFGPQTLPSANAGLFNGAQPNQSLPGFSNNSVNSSPSGSFFGPAVPTQNLTPSNNQSPSHFNFPTPEAAVHNKQAATNIHLGNNQHESVSVDASIWGKEKWNPGEIPEEAPPDVYCQ